MPKYLDDVKAQVDDLARTFADKLWEEVVEPAIKQSFKNGLATRDRDSDRSGPSRRESAEDARRR